MDLKKNLRLLALLGAMALLSACGGTPAGDSAAEDTAAPAVTEPAPAPAKEDVPAGDAEMTTGAYEDGSTPAFSGEKLRLTIEGEEVIIALYDNTAVDALLERLPLEDLSFFDLSGIEKPIQQLDEPLSLGEEEPGYDPVTGEMVIYRPWGNFTIFYGDFRYSPELVPLGKVERGLEVLSAKTSDFTGTLELAE